MRNPFAAVLVLAGASAAGLGCGSKVVSNAASSEGQLNGACYPDGSCNAGLMCSNDVCVSSPTAGDAATRGTGGVTADDRATSASGGRPSVGTGGVTGQSTDASVCPAGIDMSSDPANCGACGNVCAPITLASGQTSPGGIAVDATNAYWTNAEGGISESNGTVKKVPLAGGTPITLASGQRAPRGIAVDATSVYWTNGVNNGTVMKAPLAGGTPITLAVASNFLTPDAIAIDATNAYWSSLFGSGNSVGVVPIAGGAPITLSTSGPGPFGIAVDTTSIYWTTGNPDGKTVMKMPLAGGTPVMLAPAFYPLAIAVDAMNVYFTDYQGYNGSNGAVMKVPVNGGAVTVLASDQSLPQAIAVANASVYWVNNGDGTVMRASRDGGSPTTLASGQSEPRYIAADSKSVCWTNFASGTVMRLGTCERGVCK